MNIGILGSGAVATTLGAGLLKHNHSVMLGTRDPKKLAEWQKKNPGAKVGSFAEAAAFGEVLVLAVKGEHAADVLRMAGAGVPLSASAERGQGRGVRGKVVIDATNPIAAGPPDKGVLKFFTTLEDSLMERLQLAYPDTRFVKAFNSVGNARMVNPSYSAGRPTMFICGNDSAAKTTVTGILDQFGWETLDCGGAETARAIEPLCILWCIPGFLKNEWTHAFKVLH